MTAINVQQDHNNITMRSNEDKAFDNHHLPTTANNRMKTPRRVVSLPDSLQQQQECQTTPIAPVTPPVLDSVVSDTSTAAAVSITGKQFSNIENKYNIDTRVLGTGHFGSVRSCTDRANGRRYAVKTICKNDPAVKPGGLVREIMLLHEMKHESAVQLVDVFEDAEYVHLVTDLCSGGELFDKIVEKSSSNNGAACFTEEEAARILHQLLTAVSYMHTHDVVHRDIKPENILFETSDKDSPIKVIDFGLARQHFDHEPPMSTIVGTPYYIAPEVLRKKYDKTCDLWSVGVIAYILLCGYPPFNGNNNNETHRAISHGIYYFPSREWKGTSRESRDFIRQLLKMDPSKRMTVEEALNHPWIVRHNTSSDTAMMIDEESQDVSSKDEAMSSEEEAIPVKGISKSRKGAMLCSRLGKRRNAKQRKMRISMFGKTA